MQSWNVRISQDLRWFQVRAQRSIRDAPMKSLLVWTKAHGSLRLTLLMHTCRWKSETTRRKCWQSTLTKASSGTRDYIRSQMRTWHFPRSHGSDDHRTWRLCSIFRWCHCDWIYAGGTQQQWSDPEKIQAIVEMPAPKDPKQLKSFLGSISCYSSFVPEIRAMRGPLVDLEKEDKFVWTAEHQKVLEKLKKVRSVVDALRPWT